MAYQNKRNRPYEFGQIGNFALATKLPTDINLWQTRLAHTNGKMLKSLSDKSDDLPRLRGELRP